VVGVTVGVDVGVRVGVGVATADPEVPPQPLDSRQMSIKAAKTSRIICRPTTWMLFIKFANSHGHPFRHGAPLGRHQNVT